MADMTTGRMLEEIISGLKPRTSWRSLHAGRTRQLTEEDGGIWLGAYEQPHADPLCAIVTVDFLMPDGGVWLHLSVSRARRLPTWGDLVTARDALGYEDLLMIKMVPPKRYWLNIHNFCLHLLHHIDQPAVPKELYDQYGADGKAYGQHE